MSSLPSRVAADIRRHRLLAGGDTVVAALSGGPDSVALLLLLLDLSEELDIRVRAAHCNHGMRGTESEQDERFASELCAGLGVELDVERAEPPGAGNREERMREARYGFLCRVASAHSAALATGHTRDDRAETLLLHLFRGSGPAGLAAIPWRRAAAEDVVLVRPLLGCSRAELVEELERRRQPFRVDSSNNDISLDRNWVRAELIPLIEQRLNPGLTATLSSTSDLMAEVSEWIETAVGERLAGTPAGRLPLELLADCPPILRKGLVRQRLREARGDLRRIRHDHVEAVLGLADGQTGRRARLPGLWVEREFDSLVFYPPQGAIDFSQPITVPGVTRLPAVGKLIRIELTAEREPGSGRGAGSDEIGSVLIRVPGGPLTARNRRPGDRYRLEGRPTKTVKRLLSEMRLPRRLRDRLVCVASGDDLVWIEGLPPSADYSPQGKETLRVSVETLD